MSDSEPAVDQQDLRRAYDELDYEIVEVHDNLEVPTASPAYFDYARAPWSTDADEILDRFEESVLTLIDTHAMNGDAWHEFNVTAKVWTQINDFARVKISTAGVTILKQNEDLSFESFEEIVDAIEWTLRTDLEYTGDTDE